MSYTIDRALSDVQAELATVGLRNLIWWVDVEVGGTWEEVTLGISEGFAFGWYHPSDHHIHLPPNLLRLHNFGAWVGRRFGLNVRHHSLRDVLRHEYGHALRDALGQMGRASRLWGRAPCISPYAAGQPTPSRRSDEDFAEVFMLYLKHRGNLRHAQREDPLIASKWAAMAVAIDKGAKRRLPVSFQCANQDCVQELHGTTGRIWICPSCGQELDVT